MKPVRYVLVVSLAEIVTAAIVALILRSNPGAVDDAARLVVARCLDTAATSQGETRTGLVGAWVSTLLLVAICFYSGARWERRRARRAAAAGAGGATPTSDAR